MLVGAQTILCLKECNYHLIFLSSEQSVAHCYQVIEEMMQCILHSFEVS